VFYLWSIDLLIVGPVKTDPKHLRQTDGERFFEDRMHFKFARDLQQSDRRVRDSKDIKTIVRIWLM